MTDADRVLRLLANAGATQADIAKAWHIPVRSVQDIIQQLLTSRALRRTAKRMRAQEDASARLTLWGELNPSGMTVVGIAS